MRIFYLVPCAILFAGCGDKTDDSPKAVEKKVVRSKRRYAKERTLSLPNTEIAVKPLESPIVLSPAEEFTPVAIAAKISSSKAPEPDTTPEEAQKFLAHNEVYSQLKKNPESAIVLVLLPVMATLALTETGRTLIQNVSLLSIRAASGILFYFWSHAEWAFKGIGNAVLSGGFNMAKAAGAWIY